jgi:hypothetical protein
VGTTGVVVLVVGAMLIGVVAQFVGRPRWTYQAAVTGLAAFVGGYLSSEYLSSAGAWGPTLGGLALLPALVGALALAATAELAIRATGETLAD